MPTITLAFKQPCTYRRSKKSVEKYGFGLSSVRFICGTQDVHKELEAKFLHSLEWKIRSYIALALTPMPDFFETLLGKEDAIISDSLNHASIIDGVRLCKAMRFRYKNNDMADLEAKLKEASEANAKVKLIATDGVFSMDGYIANLKAVCDLADKYDALVMVDDSHAVGFVGENGRGTHEYCDVMGRVDMITGTLGKALGGASGGYTSGRKEIVEWLRQRSRPYLFSNTLAPVIASTSITVLDMLEKDNSLITKLKNNAKYFREKMSKAGFTLLEGDHVIIPVMLGDAKLASDMADKLMDKGIYVIGFSYPVVPMGAARIRTQMSAAHSFEDLDAAVEAFTAVGKELNII